MILAAHYNLHKMQNSLQIDYYSSKNSQGDMPNEDFMLADQQNSIFILCDGITRTPNDEGLYPDPSPAAMASRIVANTLHDKIIKEMHSGSEIPSVFKQAFEQANRKLAEFNAQSFSSFDYGQNDRAGTSAIVALYKNNNIYLGALGDCSALTWQGAGIKVFGGIQNYKLAVTYPQPHTNHQVEKVRSHRNKKDQTLGYGALTGEVAALDFLQTHTVSLEGESILCLYSAGFNFYFENPDYSQITRPLAEIDKIAIIKGAERGIHLEDRTLIRVIATNTA